MTKPELTADEEKVYLEFIQLFSHPAMQTNIRDSQLEVVASLGVGIYRQGKREVLAILKGGHNTMTDRIKLGTTNKAICCDKPIYLDDLDNPQSFEQAIRADERQAVLAEIEGLVAKVQRKITSKTFEDPNLCLDVMVDIDDSLAELRAKLQEMKGKL